MECLVEANPIPKIIWFHENQQIQQGDNNHISQTLIDPDTYSLVLEIFHPTYANGGNYRCNAFNTLGESNANISLNFLGSLFLISIW